MESFEYLSKINTKTILATLVSWRKQADKVEVKRAVLTTLFKVSQTWPTTTVGETYSRVEGDGKRVVRVWCINSWSQLKWVLHPLTRPALGLDSNASKHITGNVGDERCIKAARVRAFDPKGSSVRLLLDINAPVPVIIEAGGTLRFA